MAVLRVYWKTIRHINLCGYIYIWANLLWFALSLPIVTAPAAWAGLVHLSHKAQTKPRVNLDDFWEGFKANFKRGLVVGGLTLVILVMNLSNLATYGADGSLMSSALRALWAGAIVLWFSLLFYLWPLLMVMETPTLIGAFRNAGLMLLRNPLYTLGLWLGIAALVIFSLIFIPAWILLTGSVIAALATTATLDRLRAAGYTFPEYHQPGPVQGE